MKKFLSLIVLFVSMSASAQTQIGKVSGYIPYDENGKQVFFFSLQGNVAGGCNTTGRFVIDSTQLKFKSVQAAVMAAFHAGTDINVVYGQTCSVHGNAWDVKYICVGNIAC